MKTPAPQKRKTKPIQLTQNSLQLPIRFFPITVGLLTLIGFLLRVINISKLSLWVDEYVHVTRADEFVRGLGPLFTDDNNGILYTLFILPFYALFENNAFWARLPSVLFGTAAIPLTYYLGKQLFSRYVGLTGAFLQAFSLYLVYWSRLARNYAIFEFFYLGLLLVFWMAWESKKAQAGSGNIWDRLGLDKRYALLLAPALILSLLAHQLSFFFVFTVGLYSILRGTGQLIQHKKAAFRDKNVWLMVPALLGSILVFTPAPAPLMRNVLGGFLPAQVVEWVIPNWSRLGELWAGDKRMEVFDIYKNVLTFDYPYLYLTAIAGLAAGFFIRKKSALFMLTAWVLPFFLMSFVFRDPSLPRYLVFIYPLFLLSAGTLAHGLFVDLPRRLQWGRSLRLLAAAAPFVLLLPAVRWAGLYKLVGVEQKEGFLGDKKLSVWGFTNWKDAGEYVRRRAQPGDVVMSTVPDAVSLYLNRDDIVRFRQKFYDGEKKDYVIYPPATGPAPSAQTPEDLVKTVLNHPRGWLLADYYINNILTDPKAREYVFQNFTFHFDGSPDGSVYVFSWDHAKPRNYAGNLLLEIGKNDSHPATPEMNLNIPAQALAGPKVKMVLIAQGVNYQDEAMMDINKKGRFWIPANKTDGVERLEFEVDRNLFQPGNNVVQIGYNTKLIHDRVKGCVFYNIQVVP